MDTQHETSTTQRAMRGDWLTPGDVAERLDVPVGLVRGWIRRGWLLSYKFAPSPNGRLRISPRDLEAFIERARSEHLHHENGAKT